MILLERMRSLADTPSCATFLCGWASITNTTPFSLITPCYSVLGTFSEKGSRVSHHLSVSPAIVLAHRSRLPLMLRILTLGVSSQFWTSRQEQEPREVQCRHLASKKSR